MDRIASAGRIDVISDVICPWCYIGKRQLERALDILE
jgi:predicted DsbA family dithiol-disulfide isomerase